MGEIEACIRDAATKRGIDPDIAVKVARSEGGVDEYAKVGKFPTGWSWWPFQSDVSPRATSQDMLHRLDGHPVFGSEARRPNPASSIARTNDSDLLGGQLRAPMLLTIRVAPLTDHVGMIVLDRPEKQVIGTHARAIVAAVQNVETVRDLSEVQAPRDAVHAIANERAVRAPDLNVTVPGVLTNAGGLPAAVCLDDSSPEAGLEVLLSEPSYGIMDVHQITPGAVPPAVDAARGFLHGILP